MAGPFPCAGIESLLPLPEHIGFLPTEWPRNKKQKVPGWASEFVGRTFENVFREIRSDAFVGRTWKVSSGKLVGSPGDLCGLLENSPLPSLW